MKIYIIRPSEGGEEGDCYIGSTGQRYLCSRMTNHRNDYRKYKNGIWHYITIYDLFDKYGAKNCIIELLEDLGNDATKEQMLTREGEYITNYPCINKVNPTPKTREENLQYKKDYYYNKTKQDETKIKRMNETSRAFTKQKKEEGPITCECGQTYTYTHRKRHISTLPHRLATDEEFRIQYEAEQKIKKEELRIRRNAYKYEWAAKNKLNRV